MKYLVIALITAAFLAKPLPGQGQSRGKVIHIYESSDRKLVSGRLVNVADSTITIIRKSGSPDTLQICCTSIYSIKPSRTVTEEIGRGLLNGAFLTMMVADNQRAESSASVTQRNEGAVYSDVLAGGFAYLLINANTRNEPIIIQYSYERFRAYAADLALNSYDSN